MNKIIYLLLMVLTLSCSKDNAIKENGNGETPNPTNPPASSVKNILALGNSITEGSDYRYLLWKKMIDANYNNNFVGNRGGADEYPKYKGLTFNNRHQAVSGITTLDVAVDIVSWMENLQETPDIALIHLGTNDAEVIFEKRSTLEAVTNSMRTIISELRKKNPKIVIYLAQIIPLNTEFSEQNNLVPQINANWSSIASELKTDDSPIILVDCNTGFTLSDLGDPWHPNEQGSEKMAQRFADAILPQ